MRIIIILLLGFWWTTLLEAFVARGGDAFGEWPISNQITGKFSEPFDLSFFGMAAAILMCPFTFHATAPWVLGIAASSAAGCIGTMLTRRVWPLERAHITLAGIAFSQAAATIAAIGWERHDWILLVLSSASMAPGIIEIAVNFKPIHEWMHKFSRVEWLTAVLVSASFVLAVLTVRP